MRFDEEYRNLNAVSRLRLPNIITFLGTFLYEEDNTISRNLLLPMAIGDLRHLFSGSINHGALFQCTDSLWSQFEGLASGLQCLHDGLNMAHRDIQLSNILLYRHADDTRLIAKVSDFDLAKEITADSRSITKLPFSIKTFGSLVLFLLSFLHIFQKAPRALSSSVPLCEPLMS
jgi:serine/threonine protein kinase